MIQKIILAIMIVMLGANLYAWTALTAKNEKIVIEINERLNECSIQSK